MAEFWNLTSSLTHKDIQMRHMAAIGIRKLLTIEQDSLGIIQQAIDATIITHLVSLVQQS